MMRYFICALLGLCLCASPGTAKTLSRIIAVVNDDIITSYQLDQAVQNNLAQMTNQNQLTAAQFEQVKQQSLDKLINDLLMEQKIKEYGLRVSDSELTAAIDDVRRKNDLTEDALVNALSRQGMTMAEYREKIKAEILQYKLMGREINSKAMVTSGEIRDYFRDHIEEYRVKPTIHVRHIAYTVPADVSQEEREQLLKQIEVTRQLLLDGTDFETVLAGQQDNADGVDMGEMVETDLAPQLQEILAPLKKGEVSEAVDFNGYLHLFQVADRSPGDIHLFDRVKGSIEQKLREEKIQVRYQEWEKDLRASAHIDIRI